MSDILLAGDYGEILPQSESIYAFVRNLGNRKLYVLVNFTTNNAPYDATIVAGAQRVEGNYSDAQPGTLRPLEAVIYTRED